MGQAQNLAKCQRFFRECTKWATEELLSSTAICVRPEWLTERVCCYNSGCTLALLSGSPNMTLYGESPCMSSRSTVLGNTCVRWGREERRGERWGREERRGERWGREERRGERWGMEERRG